MPNQTPLEPERFPIRRLDISDNTKGFIDLLSQLTHCDPISDEEFRSRFRDLASQGDHHVICVIEDDRSRRIIATGSVFIEKKFIRNLGMVGHIEDVVVHSSARGQHLGQKIMRFLSDHARSMGCYKVILDCEVENKGFYEKCGFKEKGVQMSLYFD